MIIFLPDTALDITEHFEASKSKDAKNIQSNFN